MIIIFLFKDIWNSMLQFPMVIGTSPLHILENMIVSYIKKLKFGFVTGGLMSIILRRISLLQCNTCYEEGFFGLRICSDNSINREAERIGEFDFFGHLKSEINNREATVIIVGAIKQ